MIFASDLDRTLIYSKKFLSEYKEEVCIVETKPDQTPITYISKEVWESLKGFSKEITFVPVTTRSFVEYKRTIFFDFADFAIIDNGGTILNKGTPIVEWENMILEKMKKYDLQGVVELLKGKSFIFREPVIIDGKFIFFKSNDEEKCKKFCNNFIDLEEYNCIIQRQKVYIIPKFISKQNALKFLSHMLKSKYIVSAGDSSLDEGLLKMSNLAIIPKHATVNFGNLEGANYFVTQSEGISSSCKIIKKVAELMKVKQKPMNE